jgi:exosortase/archaeosortase family protein
MGYPLYLAIAVVVLAAILVGFGVSGHVIRLLGKRGRKPSGFSRFLLRYVVAFGVLLGLEAFVLWVLPSFHEQLRDSAANIVGGILRLAGEEASVDGSLVSVGSTSAVFDITVACLGGVLFWVYLALIAGETKASGGQRLKGIVIGLALLSAFNLSRIVLSVYLEGSTGLRVHDYFYAVNMLVVLLVWAGWQRTLKPTGRMLVARSP